MFIDPIVKLKGRLHTDQRIELAFFASLLTNPFWFHYAMAKMIDDTSYAFGMHPLYDLVSELYMTFGTWQGGPHGLCDVCKQT